MATKKKKKKIVTLKPRKRGQKAIQFQEGGLHATTGTPPGENIPMEKIRKALAGGFGPKGVKQAQLAQGVLQAGHKTTKKKRKKKKK